MILRLAIVAASLAWGGFVFTHTVGDPGRGDDVARAVLADDAARAQVVSPITSAVMTSTGLPAEQRPFVSSRVDQILRQPDGARTFVESFAGGWARMLGDNDPRGSRIDLTPFLDDIAASVPGIDPSLIPTQADTPASVPVPRRESPWLGDLRRVINALVIPLAVIAAVGMATAFAIGDRRWVLRRIGLWAVFAGGAWIVGPLIAVWAAERWVTGADEVVRVAVEEAVAGLRPVAIILAALGLAAFVFSFFIVDARDPAPVYEERRRRSPRPAGAVAEPVRPTAVAPQRRRQITREQPVIGPHTVAPTMTMPAQPLDPDATPPAGATKRPAAAQGDEADSLWDYYTEPDD